MLSGHAPGLPGKIGAAASGSERWRYDTGFAPSQLGAWDVAVAEGLVVVPGAGFLLALG